MNNQTNKAAAKKGRYEIDMTNGPIMIKMITFFVPLLCSNVLQLLFNAVDLAVVGHFTGRLALASVGANSILVHVFTNLFIGISMGTNVLTARNYAAGDKKAVHDTVHTAITFALISGIVMIFVGLFFSPLAHRIMDTPEDVLDGAILYMRIYFLGMPFFMLYNYGAAILRAVGDTRRPLAYLTIAGVINAGLNLFLVIVFDLGVIGVAVATVASQLISCILVIRAIMNTQESYRLNPRELMMDGKVILRILKVGLPTGIQSTVISFSNAMLQSSVNSFGSITSAGYTAAQNLQGFMYQSINSVTQACMSFTSQNMGVGKRDRMDKVFAESLFLEMLVGAVVGWSFFLGGRVLLGFYTDSPEVIAEGLIMVKGMMPLYFICSFMDCIPGAMRGMGESTLPMIFCILGTVGTRIVWIQGLFPAHRTIEFLYMVYPVSWIVSALMQGTCYFFVRKKVHRKMQQTAALAHD